MPLGRRRAIVVTALLLCMPTLAAVPARVNPGEPIAYPAARRGDHVDSYHGVAVVDPYRWLENIDSEETRAWVRGEQAVSGKYLAVIPARKTVLRHLQAMWSIEEWTAPERHGAYWYYRYKTGLENQAVLFVSEVPGGRPTVVLDPNRLASDGSVALKRIGVSDDGTLFAYGLSHKGSDWEVWHIRDVHTDRDLPDEIRWVKFGRASWRKDGTGFYYSGYEAPTKGAPLTAVNRYQTLYFHRLGTPQGQDVRVYRRTDDSNWYVRGEVTDDGRYLIIQARHGADARNVLLIRDLSVADAAIASVISEPKANYDFVGNVGSTLYIRTDDNAPRYRIVAIDVASPDRAHWQTVVPEAQDSIEAATLIGAKLILQLVRDAHNVVQRYERTGRLLGDVMLPGLGSTDGFYGHVEDALTFFTYSSFTTPTSIYRFDVGTGEVSLWRSPRLRAFRSNEYETRQERCPSGDGTEIHLFITALKGVKLDGVNPTILYGYGGFNSLEEPDFSPAIAVWLQLGGVYAVANIRGGGEYGRAWHQAGMTTHKQNVFDDFIAAAQCLIAQKWTSPRRLAMLGESNGGLLVGAVEEERPDLFAVAVAKAGIMDMLRFREFTVGKGWEPEYGSVDNPDEFKALLAYSPYHNVREDADYPATLLLTGDHDDRVYPAHSFKFAAALQHANPHGEPVLLRVYSETGHGAGEPVSKKIGETADIYAFMLKAMGLGD